MKRVVFLGIWLAMLLLRVGTLQGQSYTMTNGQTITTCSGTFYDPGGPNGSYDNNMEYTQTFKSSSPYLCLKVTFTSFVTESGFDKLYVYDGESTSGTLLGTYSGTLPTFSVVSSAGALTFVFHSDYSIVKSGWEATISCEDCSLPSPTVPDYSMHHGKDTIDCSEPPRPFYDPGGFGGNYVDNSDYIQTFVSSNPNMCLTVTFTSFATEWYMDKLYIYDGPVASGTILGVYSGYLDGFSVSSYTGALTFVFHSDNSYNEEGWSAFISCSECAEPPEPTGNMHYGTDTIYCSQAPIPFYDPGGPGGNYDYLSDYVQTFVSSDPNSCLQVTFTSIEVEEDWDMLYVYDGTSVSSTLLATLTGSMSNVTITSYTGALTFQFFSDDFYNDAGWEAVISCSDCAVPPTPPPPPDPNPCSPNGIHPFCTDENPNGITYSSGTSGENASSFLGSSQYSCLYITPNPAWYYMQISDPGDLLLYIEQVSTAGSGLDVDFVCWGPFSATSQGDFVDKLCNGAYTLDDVSHGSHRPTDGNHQNNMGGYPDGNVVDCSYSAQSTEWCFIPNAQQGEWYLFLITNYSGQLGSITFNLVDEYSFATTNCNLLVPFSYNEPICEGDTLVLTCENPLPGAIYNWSGPGGWTAVTTDPFVNIPNASAGHSGQYELHITGIGDTTVQPFQLDVAIQAMPQVTVTASADAVCEGTSVILQAGGAANYEWSPTAGTGSSITVTPGSTTTYTVIGTTGACSDTAFGQVTVFQNTTGDTSAVVCDSFDWYEHVGLTNSGNYQHTFTNAEGCDSVVTLQLTVGGMSDVTISTPHNAICSGGSVELKAIPDDAVSYSYLWNTGETTAMITDTPDQTTEYSVTVTDGYGCKDSASVTIMVSTTSVQTFYGNVCRGEAYEGYGFTLTEEETDTSGTLTLIHTDTVGPGCISTKTLWLTVYESSNTTINQTACDSLVWNGVTYFESIVLRDTLETIHGCDSIVTVTLTVIPSAGVQIITDPSPAAVCAGGEIALTAVTECGGSGTLLYEGFDALGCGNIAQTQPEGGPGGTELTFPSDDLTNAFISGVKAFPAGGAVKLGNTSNIGSITSNYLDLTQDFIVTIRAKGWIFNSNPKKTKIRVSTNPYNAQEFIVNGNSDFADYSLAFSAAGANAQLTIETVNANGNDKRVFIDFVSITRDVPCAYYWYTSADTINTETEITVTPPSSDWYYFTATSPEGCMKTDSVEVVVNTPVHTAISKTDCESYTWVDGTGQTYTLSNDYTYAHQDANGCMQVDTLHLTIHNPTHQSYTVDTCGAYTWEGGTGTTYTTSGDYMYMHKDENECWQVDTLHLTIHNPTHQSYTVDTCGAYMWEGGTGTTYTASGNYLYKHNDGNGCMQVDTLHLTIHPSSCQVYTEEVCTSYTWIDGITYTTSGDRIYSHANANGCTQVDTLYLTIKDTVLQHIYAEVCLNNPYETDGFQVDAEETGTAGIEIVRSHTDEGANGCDSTTVLHLTVKNTALRHIYAEVCLNNPYETDGFQVDAEETGTAGIEIVKSRTDEGANGCDSTTVLHLTVKDTVLRHIYADICLNNEYYDYGFWVSEEETNTAGIEIEKNRTDEGANGCDSTTVLHLTVKDTLLRHIYDTVCFNGGNYDSYGFELTEEEMSSTADTLLDHLDMGANECDSMTVLHLTVFHPAHQSFTETAYDNYTWTSGNGNTYVQSGTYTYEHCDENGCTQNDTLYLTVHYTSSNVFSKDTCDSYNWDGRILTQTGTYDTIYTDQYGADSAVTLHLIIHHATHQVDIVTACDSCVWNGSTYTEGGVYVYEYINSEGCPSADTLYLTIITTPEVIVSGPHVFCPDSSVTLTAVTETAPDSYLWSNGATTSSITVSEAGVYTVTAYYAGGCSAESAGFHVFETENPIVDGFLHDMVAGDTQTVVIGTMTDDNLQYILPQSTLTYSTVTFLPDGQSCDSIGCSYRAEMSFSGFPDTAVVHSADEIRYIRLNMEHSSPVDLYIRLICPDEQQADILRKHDDDSESECLSFIDGSHIGWPDGNVDQVYYGNLPYIRAWMGQPNIFFDDEVDLCDSSKNKPGVGWNYCWSDNTTEGYQYASANGCLVDTSNSIYYYQGGIQDLYYLSYIIMDSTNVAAGTQYYHPDESFDSLIGCHINGTWTIEVIDGITNDNGYIFECEMGVAEHLSATHYAHVSEMFFDGMWAGAGGTDSTFVIMPPEDLANDTTVAYTFTLIDENGCTFDTVIHINVYAHKHIDLYDTVNSSQLPLVWEGLTFNGAGCQDTLLHTVHGADSLVTLHLSVIYHYDTAVCTNKTPLLWHNQTFYSTSTVTVSQSVENGCADSIEVLMVKVHPVFQETEPRVICASETPFEWRGGSYSATGTYYDSLVSVVTGCDSIYELQLVVNPTFIKPFMGAICQGDTFQFFGQPLTEEGVYTETLQTVHGCDSVITLTLAVNPIYSISLADTICEGDTFHFFSQHLTETGVYTETLQTVHGCDSVFILNLTVHPTYSIPLADTICQGDTFLFFNQPLTETGVYTETLQTVHGCDSVYTLSLTVHPTYSIPLADTICQGDTFHFFSQLLTEAGVYTKTLQTVDGCDSVFTLTLTVHPTYSIPLVEEICQGDTFHFFNQHLTETGVYTDTLQTVDGCDSVFILSLTVDEIFHGVTDMVVCESDTPYNWRGNGYSATGTYCDTLSVPQSCDSIFILNLTVYPITSADTFVVACDSFVWRGVTYHETPAALPADTLAGGNAGGCDSVTVLHLTIHHSAVRFDTVDICEGELPYTYGNTVFESGTLSGDFVFHDTTTYGCDSIVRLNLQVTQNIRTTQVPFIICENHLPAVWNVPGRTHYIPDVTSGDTTIVDTFHFASNGCDSIVTRKLIIGTITDTTIVDTIVENQLPYWLNGKSYDSTGIYLDTVTNGNGAGCDIIITLDLTVFFNVRTPLDSIICNNKVPLIWNGLTFTETGMDSVVFVMDNGADSTVVMNVTVNDTSHYTLPISVLENNLPDTLNGFVYDTTGIYTQHLTNAVGCDSTLTIDFTVLYNVRTELYHAECDGDILWPYEWNGVLFTGPGTDSITATAASGVDSTVVMTLVVNYPTAGTSAATVLENNLPYELNGYSYDTTGTYIQHLTNANGCDSTLTLELTVFFNDTITIDSTVCDNELGFYWNGVCFTEADTQSVVLNTSTGADSVVVMRVHVIESPDVTISGPPVFCADNFAQLTAVSATAISYHWSTGDTTQSINANVTGIYAVTVTNEYGCKDSDLMNLSEAVIVNPIASYQFPDLCAGNDYSITIGHQSISTIVLDNPESTLSWADTVFLPDGKNCPPYGCSYQSPLTFTDFAPGSVVSSVNDILYVRLNMEHSYAGDLYINLKCPNGQKADILRFDGTANSNCSSQIPISSRNWQPGNNADDDTYFGMAYDHSSTGNNACNPNTNNNAPGIGWNYCWSNNNNQGYTYAPGQGSLVYRSVNAHTHTNAYYSFFSGENHYVDIFDSSNVAEGTKFYHPDQSFQNLVGCPLNGSWTIEVMDGWTQDNGYIFGWELALAPYLVPTPYSDVTFVWVEGPWVTTVSDTSFIFSPPDTLEHDTLVAYTFHLQDQYGCGYDTTVYLNVYAQSHTVIDTNVCASFDYNGVTYTQSETITWNGVNVHGCDSTCVINLTVYPMPTTAITGLPVPCVDDTAHLAAVCADPDALLVWSTGDAAQTITVTSSGDYTVTATNAKCSYDETVTVTFSSPNESTTDLTVCDSILWNGTVYTQTGSYVKTLTNAAGCDSVATLNLTVNYSYLSHDTLYLLENQLPYTFEPSDTLFPVGSPAEFQFSYTLPAQNSCDSVIMEKVYVYMNYSHTFDTLVCASAVPLTWHEHTFTATGTVTELHSTVHGSDSLLIYTVTVDTVSATIGNVTHINCYGESNGAATATVTGGISPLTYQWTNGAGASVSSATLLNNRPAGDYKFTVTDAAGCSATDSVTINLLHGQMLPGTITGLQSLCYGDMLGTVTGTAATGDDCTYQWQMSTDGTVWAPLPGTNNTQNYLFQTPATSSFQLRRAWISTGCGTLYSDTLDISVWPVSNDTIHDNVCVGIPYQNYGFDISAAETSLPGTQIFEMRYSSQNGCDSSVTLVLAVNEPQETDFDVEICEGDGYYGNGFAILPMETIGTDTLLRVLNLNTTDGCDSVVRLEVTVIDTMLRIVSPTVDFCEDVSAELIVETNMPDYEWSTGEMTPNIIVTSPGVYSVTATQGGCSVTARYTIEPCVFQLYLPNAITPGRTDHLNDYFCIPESSRNAINLFEISIVNRWGELVFYSTDKNFMWNGEYKGKIFHHTVYNYIIEYTDFAGRQFRVTGSITVL